MKKRGIIWLLSLCVLCSCDDFLNVSADNELLQEEIFSSNNGVRMAVNGVYKELSSTALYAKNLSWGFASAIGQNYQATSSTYLPYDLYMAANFEWEESSAMLIAEEIWQHAYNVIASCNNIIQEVTAKDTSFFELGNVEKQMILGEMHGIRALLHFDLFRLFCPAPVTGEQGHMPYVTTYPDHQPEHVTSDTVMARVIRDMETARRLLATVDTVFCRSWMTSVSGRLRSASSWSTGPPNEFVNYRGHRLNFIAATALLARIHMYDNDHQKAYEMARLAYSFHTRNWFRWTSSVYQGQITDVDYIYVKRYDELFLAFANNKNYNNWEATLGTSSYYFRVKNTAELFRGDEDDFRLVGWYNRYNDQRYITWVRPRGTSYTAQSVANDQGPLLPVIRFSEMYHIMIECLIEQGRVPEALTLFRTLRTNRGAKATIAETIPVEELKDKLVLDIVRETLTEGQTFFLFKRLNRDMFNGTESIIMSPRDWVIPIPDSETTYQFN
ncbi:MAG: RagB/SusD family nutrient uptake outer membrane protein [Odoribacteraceae bacterium]|nr:RagB/SusD family nutrient uptake outer membrane protein [Odoribacteraceae bacterium]